MAKNSTILSHKESIILDNLIVKYGVFVIFQPKLLNLPRITSLFFERKSLKLGKTDDIV